MSRVGIEPVDYAGAKLEIKDMGNMGTEVFFAGPHGENKILINADFNIVKETLSDEQKTRFQLKSNDILKVLPKEESLNDKRRNKFVKSMWGTYTRILKWCASGVVKPFSDNIQLVGIGYKVVADGPKKLKFSLGFSHDKIVEIPELINVKIVNITNLTVSSCNKEKLGQFVNYVCSSLRKYNVYSGKGVILLGGKRFYIRKKAKR